MREYQASYRQHISVHHVLGDGSVADVLLWRKRYASILLLVSGTILWILFSRAGYSPLSFIANVLLLLVIVLFFWAKSASLLNRPLPPIPDMEVSAETMEEIADVIRVWINRAFTVVHEIVICGNLRILVQVAMLLWLTSFISSIFNLVTFAYIGFLLVLSVPLLYEKHQEEIDDNLVVMRMILEAGYKKLDETVFRKAPVSLYKKKKSQ